MAIRQARDTDRNLILHSWIRELRTRGPSWIRALPEPVFSDVVPRLVRGLLDVCTVHVIAVDGDDDTVMGWIAYERGAPVCVHYAWVKAPFRGYGLGRALLESVPGAERVYSVSTRVVCELECAGKIEGWRFVPLRLLGAYQREAA